MQGGLILFDDEQVIRLLLLDNVAGRLALSMHRIRCNECTFQRQGCEQFWKFGFVTSWLRMGVTEAPALKRDMKAAVVAAMLKAKATVSMRFTRWLLT